MNFPKIGPAHSREIEIFRIFLEFKSLSLGFALKLKGHHPVIFSRLVDTSWVVIQIPYDSENDNQ